MNTTIEIQDNDQYVDVFVDSQHAARMEFITKNTYKTVFANDSLPPLVLHGLFLTVLKQRAGEWSNS